MSERISTSFSSFFPQLRVSLEVAGSEFIFAMDVYYLGCIQFAGVSFSILNAAWQQCEGEKKVERLPKNDWSYVSTSDGSFFHFKELTLQKSDLSRTNL